MRDGAPCSALAGHQHGRCSEGVMRRSGAGEEVQAAFARAHHQTATPACSRAVVADLRGCHSVCSGASPAA